MRIDSQIAVELPERATLHRGSSSNRVTVNAINVALALQAVTLASCNSADASQYIVVANG